MDECKPLIYWILPGSRRWSRMCPKWVPLRSMKNAPPPRADHHLRSSYPLNFSRHFTHETTQVTPLNTSKLRKLIC